MISEIAIALRINPAQGAKAGVATVKPLGPFQSNHRQEELLESETIKLMLE